MVNYHDQVMLDRANKFTFEDEKIQEMEMYCCELYPYNNGYFDDIQDFIKWWIDNHKPDEHKPEFVWGTYKVDLCMSASDIIDIACEDLHEDARDNITDEKELQMLLDEWCSRQSGTATFWQDKKCAIMIPW